ncbi:MAG: hypothetical protein P9X22_07340 [Candidatus Zapsychrus exili]|nr:hypothetical protein [Candidatus Zapsychrus exili]
MNFYLIGINYNTSSLKVREQAFKKRLPIESFLNWLSEGGAVVLTTCNRFEVYGITKDDTSAKFIYGMLLSRFPKVFKDAYLRDNTKDVVVHALRLSCGLDSQILGEHQVVEQLRRWIKRDGFPNLIKEMWDVVLDWSKDIRLISGIDSAFKDIADFVLDDIKELKAEKLLVIGTGKVAELISKKDIGDIKVLFVARKKHIKAKKLARNAGGDVISFDELPYALEQADVIISATSSPHYILDKKDVEKFVNKNKRIYDLSIPRDVNPDVKQISGIVLKSLDDISFMAQDYNKKLKPCVKRAGEFAKEAAELIIGDSNAYKDKSWSKAERACAKTGSGSF